MTTMDNNNDDHRYHHRNKHSYYWYGGSAAASAAAAAFTPASTILILVVARRDMKLLARSRYISTRSRLSPASTRSPGRLHALSYHRWHDSASHYPHGDDDHVEDDDAGDAGDAGGGDDDGDGDEDDGEDNDDQVINMTLMLRRTRTRRIATCTVYQKHRSEFSRFLLLAIVALLLLLLPPALPVPNPTPAGATRRNQADSSRPTLKDR